MCDQCNSLGIGINIRESHKHCNRCGCPNTWDFKLQNPLPNSGKNGWWKEVLTGEIHWNRCDEFKKKCTEIKQTEKDTVPVGMVKSTQNTLSSPPQPKPQTASSQKSESKPDEEILNIVRKCGELESVIYNHAKELAKRYSEGNIYVIDNIANRLTEIYNTRKINERLDRIILELDSRMDK